MGSEVRIKGIIADGVLGTWNTSTVKFRSLIIKLTIRNVCLRTCFFSEWTLLNKYFVSITGFCTVTLKNKYLSVMVAISFSEVVLQEHQI